MQGALDRQSRWYYPLLGLAVALLAIVAAYVIDRNESSRYRHHKRDEVRASLTGVRAHLEGVLNARIHLARGLKAIALTHPEIPQEEFRTFAQALIAQQSGVRSLQLAPRGVVRYIHPIEGNEAALGHDLLADPAVSAAAEQAIRSRQLVLAGPYTLRQGGVGLVGRLPVFLTREDGSEEDFWGFATVLIDFPAMLQESGLASVRDIEVALRGLDGQGDRGAVFHGAAEIFTDEPVEAEVQFPNGRWLLAARPIGGWEWGWRGRRWLAGILALLLGTIAFVVRVQSRHQAVKARAERLALRETLLDSLGEGVYGIDPSGRCTFINPAALSLLGRTREEVIGKDAASLFLRDPASLASMGERHECETWLLRKDGGAFPAHVIVAPLEGQEGAVVAFSDITERKQAGERLRLAASVFAHTQQGIMITDASGRLLDVNPAFTAITGYERDDVVGLSPKILSSGRQTPEFYAAMWDSLTQTGFWRGELWNRHKSGRAYPELLSVAAVGDEAGGVSHYIGVFSDISRQKAHEAELARIAHFDALTGLPNRALLTDRLAQSLDQARRAKSLVAVCMLDLDGFKEINDRFGHDAGDAVLMEVARRLKATMRAGDTVARLGGDEFVLLMMSVEGVGACEGAAYRVLQLLSKPYVLEGQDVQVSASIGITIFPDDAADADMLLRHADQAMYAAKQAGRNRYLVFDPERDRRAESQRQTLERIAEGLAANEFVLHYQPKVDMRAGKVLDFEALIRWRHPEHGLLLPAEFLPVISATDLDVAVGRWVLARAVSQLTEWHAMGFDFGLSVNISATHLLSPGFADDLQDLLAAHPSLARHDLELEILETDALSDLDAASEVLRRCGHIGVRVALDDFGTGYSSLAYFRRLPVSTLKIDQMFVRDMLGDVDDMAIVEGVIGFAKAFNRRAVAEGVETPELCLLLLSMGCDIGQGHGIAPAMPADEVPGWVRGFRPPAEWSATVRWHPDELPLLAAQLDHRRWVGQMQARLFGTPPAQRAPVLDYQSCRFGRWYYGRGRKRYGNCPSYETLGRTHMAVHDLGQEFERLCEEGLIEEAKLRYPDLLELRDRLVAEMNLLRSEIAPTRQSIH